MKPKSMQEVEKEHIREVLTYTKGHKGNASKILGLSVQTIKNKIRQHDLKEFIADEHRGQVHSVATNQLEHPCK